MTDKMREEFEEYMNGQGFDVDHIYVNGEFKCYCFAATQNAFEIWKASRAALCVELPSRISDDSDKWPVGYDFGVDAAADSLDSVGVHYK